MNETLETSFFSALTYPVADIIHVAGIKQHTETAVKESFYVGLVIARTVCRKKKELRGLGEMRTQNTSKG